MSITGQCLAGCLLILLTVLPVYGEIHFNGFASLVIGRSYSANEDQVIVDYPAAGTYTAKASMEAETLVGLQMLTLLRKNLSTTVQILGKGTDQFNAQLEWAYFSYNISPDWTFQGGRKRLPLYFYSDSYDIGYSYLWIRPPQDNYTWQIFNYNGFNIVYRKLLESDWIINTNLYTGREDSKNNQFNMRSYRSPVRQIINQGETWKNIYGIVINFTKDLFDIRLNYMSAERQIRERIVNIPSYLEDSKIEFYGISLNIDNGKWIFLSELNLYQEFIDNSLQTPYWETWLSSLGYRFEQLTPYISHSVFDSKQDIEDHETLSVGIRWDFHPSVSLKVQFDKIKDYGQASLSTNSDMYAIGMDAVF